MTPSRKIDWEKDGDGYLGYVSLPHGDGAFVVKKHDIGYNFVGEDVVYPNLDAIKDEADRRTHEMWDEVTTDSP